MVEEGGGRRWSWSCFYEGDERDDMGEKLWKNGNEWKKGFREESQEVNLALILTP